jgi:BMFP domain-containing protein YqiC
MNVDFSKLEEAIVKARQREDALRARVARLEEALRGMLDTPEMNADEDGTSDEASIAMTIARAALAQGEGERP